MSARVSYLCAVVCAVGCHAPDSHVITGDWRWNYVVLQSTAPIDMRESDLQIFAQTGSLEFKEYPSLPIRGVESGTFSIAAPTDADLLLKVREFGIDYWYQTEAQHRVRRPVLGRPDAERASKGTELRLELAGLAPWAATDSLYVNSWENATEAFGIETELDVSEGDSALSGSFTWSGLSSFSWGPYAGPYFLDAARGDTLTISRLTGEQRAGAFVQILTQTTTVGGITQSDGVPSVATGVFGSIPASRSYRFTATDDLIHGLIDRFQPNYISLSLRTGPGSHAAFASGPPLASVTSQNIGIDESISYGNSFNPSWPVVAMGILRLGRDIRLGARTLDLPWLEFSSFIRVEPAGDSFDFSAPEATADAFINGQLVDDAFIERRPEEPMTLEVDTTDGSWRVEVFRLVSLSTTRLGLQLAAVVTAQSPKVTLPGNFIVEDGYYVIRVSTLKTSNPDRFALAALLTGKFRVGSPDASFCGDGVIDRSRGEQCDDGSDNAECVACP